MLHVSHRRLSDQHTHGGSNNKQHVPIPPWAKAIKTGFLPQMKSMVDIATTKDSMPVKR